MTKMIILGSGRGLVDVKKDLLTHVPNCPQRRDTLLMIDGVCCNFVTDSNRTNTQIGYNYNIYAAMAPGFFGRGGVSEAGGSGSSRRGLVVGGYGRKN